MESGATGSTGSLSFRSRRRRLGWVKRGPRAGRASTPPAPERPRGRSAGPEIHDARPEETAVAIGSALGGVPSAEADHAEFLAMGPRSVPASIAPRLFAGAGARNGGTRAR